HAAPAIADLVHQVGPDEVQLSTPLQPALGGPVTAEEMNAAAAHFSGLPLYSVYAQEGGIGPLRVG
ncbi:MAG TPA: hypothetical protein VM366_02675, partial [Anaerolineae bacterium]|nr:hypothetical protein [Anaerolineae bacterium]